VLYQLSKIIINYLEIPNAIPTGNHLREATKERRCVRVYDDAREVCHVSPNSNVNGGSQGFDMQGVGE
jgi:hypothetical protein